MTKERIENEALVHDLVAWLAEKSRTHAQVLATWGSTCPRLTIWEDALDAGLVRLDGDRVRVTAAGEAFIAAATGRKTP